MPADPSRVQAVFLAAVELPDPAARAALLDRECGSDAALRERVERLLAAHREDSFLRTRVGAPVPPVADSAGTGSLPVGATRTFPPDADPATRDHPSRSEHAGAVVAGKYALVDTIGEGGMGSVWRAKQTEPVKRFVAVKLIKAGMDSKQVLARFEAERQALALMDHPNIAKVLDGGIYDGRPFFVMELVKGVPITEYCDAQRLTPQQRLELFVQVCQAIQHAHQKGVIHRDIKPSNVLVALYDDRPVVKVIDFGVAKAAGTALTERTLDTGFGAVVGTPQYMSPEQATFNNLDIDTRSDVYALGVLLYELLTGSPPFSKRELEQKGLMEILRVVREEEPPRPSTKLSTSDALPSLSANRGTEPKKLTGLLRNELDWIVMKALDKDRARRYETANGFAADVQRYLSGEPVLAHPPSWRYRFRKFLRKHRGGVTAVAVVAAALLVGLVGTGWGLVEARNQRDAADAARTAAEEAGAREAAERKKVEEREQQLAAQKNDLEVARRDVANELHDSQRTQLLQAWNAGDRVRVRALLDEMRPKHGAPDFRGFETHYMDRAAHPETDCYTFRAMHDGVVLNSIGGHYRRHYDSHFAENGHVCKIFAFDLLARAPVEGFTPIQAKFQTKQTSGLAVRWFQSADGPKLVLLEPEVLPLREGGIDPDMQSSFAGMPYVFLQIWDGLTGKQMFVCDRLYPDPALAAAGWRHRFLSADPIETMDGKLTTVVTQMIRDVKPAADGKSAQVESRALLHDLRTGQVKQALDPNPGGVALVRFTADNRCLLTAHTTDPKNDRIPRRYTMCELVTGKALWSRELVAAFKGFTTDGTGALFGTNANTGPATSNLDIMTGNPLPLPAEEWKLNPAAKGMYASNDGPFVVVTDARTNLPIDRMMVGAAEDGFAWISEQNVPHFVSFKTWSVSVNNEVTHENLQTISTCRVPRSYVIPCTPMNGGETSAWYEARTGSDRDPYLLRLAVRVLPDGNRQGQELRVINARTGAERTIAPPNGAASFEKPDYRFGITFHGTPNWNERGVGVVAGSTLFAAATPTRPKDAPPDYTGDLSQGLAVVDLVSGAERFYYRRPAKQFNALRVGVNADGSRLAIVTQTEIEGLDGTTGRVLWTNPLPKGDWFVPPAFLPNSRGLALFGEGSGTLQLLNTETGKVERSVTIGPNQPKPGTRTGIREMELTPDGRSLLVSLGPDLWVIDTTEWKVRHTLARANAERTEPTAPNGAWHISPRQVHDRFLVYRRQKTVEVWDILSGQRRCEFEISGKSAYPNDEQLEFVYSADGSRMFLLTHSALRVIDLRRGREVLVLDSTPSAGGRSVLSLSPDGHELTVYTERLDRGGIVKRVYDARPLTDEEIARAHRVHKTQTIPPPYPTRPKPKPPVTASDYVDQAGRLGRVPDRAGQVAALRKAVELEPNFAPWHRKLARILRDQDPATALAEFRETVRLDPSDYFSHWEIGLLLKGAKKPAAAAEAFRKAVEGDVRPQGLLGTRLFFESFPPEPWQMHTELAQTLKEVGQDEAAEDSFRTAFRAQPNEFTFQPYAKELLARGKFKELEQEAEALVKLIEGRIQREPKNADHVRARAQTALIVSSTYLWSFDGHFAEIVTWSDRAIKLFTEYYKGQPAVPDDQNMLQPARWNRAVGLHWQGKSADALAELERFYKSVPERDQPQHRMFRTRFVARSGDHVVAAATIQELMKTPAAGAEEKWFYWNAALAYAQCALAVKGDDKLRVSYEEKGLALLRKAVTVGLDSGPFVRMDPDLHPLRARADFKKLVEELKSKGPSQPPGDKK